MSASNATVKRMLDREVRRAEKKWRDSVRNADALQHWVVVDKLQTLRKQLFGKRLRPYTKRLMLPLDEAQP